MNMSSCYTSIDNKNILIDHDGSKLIYIHDQPIELPHSSSKKSQRLQHIDMLDFQDRIAMASRIRMKQRGISLPLARGRYRMEISIESSRDLKQLPLCDTMKSIMDGVDEEVIYNDADIYECSITYQALRCKSRQPASRSEDIVSYKIIDLSTGRSVVNVAGLNTYIVPKKVPYLLNRLKDEYIYVHFEGYYSYIWDALKLDKFAAPTANTYNVRMHFKGSIQSKDLDNMARCYLPLLYETKDIREDNIIKLELSKEVGKSNDQCVEIQIV